jgi:hypothetical protein
MPPAAAKNTTATQASEFGSLFVTIAAKIVRAANSDHDGYRQTAPVKNHAETGYHLTFAFSPA